MRVLILGAGFGGLTLATELEPLAASGAAEVTLVDRKDTFTMGFSMQWVLAGRRSRSEGDRPYSALLARHVRFLKDEVLGIDTSGRVVQTTQRALPYDRLVIALGAELAPGLVPGLSETGYNLCDFNSVMGLKAALEGQASGTVLVAVASVPFKCPPAPYEYALLIDDMFRARGTRDASRILVTTPEPQPMPVAGKAVGEAVKSLLSERRIEFLPSHKPKAVDGVRRAVVYENGVEVAFDILGAMPPHRAPKVVRDAGLADASGFVPVDLWSLRTSIQDVYAVGDVAALKLPNGSPHPKAGIFAEEQARAVARDLTKQIAGGMAERYSGRGVCFVDVGGERAAAAEADLLGEAGPRIELRAPTREGLLGKREFERERFSRWFGG